MKLALGLISGTSADGVSAALISADNERADLQAYATYPYSNTLRQKALNAREMKAAELSRLNFELGAFFAESASKLLRAHQVQTSWISVIGSHGQTVYHGPRDHHPNTLQIAEPALIAERTGIPVVANFRPRDIAAGGQGAPLIPYFDWFYYKKEAPIALLNIGGIANVTLVTQMASDVMGFDTGPGNCLLDFTLSKKTKGRILFDKGGKLAYKGKTDDRAVCKTLAHPYFKRRPPKSTGRELFEKEFLNRHFAEILKKPLPDIAATLGTLTARSIFIALKNWVFPRCRISKILASGGGAHNVFIMSQLSAYLRDWAHGRKEKSVLLTVDVDLPLQAKEPMAFALMALRAIQGKPNHIPSATGAKGQRILGCIYPA